MPTIYATLGVLATVFVDGPAGVRADCNPETLRRFPGGWPKKLDVSVYWFGANDETERATGMQSSHYNPSKNTVVLIDGWGGWDKVISCHRMTSMCLETAHCPPNTSIAKPWIDRGWNFGIFYWDQFADTTCTTWAETKIWQTKEDRRMTWKSYDVAADEEKRTPYDGPEASVGELCARMLREAMPTQQGRSVRLVGFSMGAQLAASCAEHMLRETPAHPAAPSRLTLIDPFFQSFIKGMHVVCYGYGFDYKRTTWLTVRAVQSLWQRGVAMELYKGSGMTEGSLWGFNPAREIETLGTLVQWDPLYCGVGVTSFHCRHEACVPSYYMRMGEASPEIESADGIEGNCKIPGPNCTDDEIIQLVKQQNTQVSKGKRHVWSQIAGRRTWAFGDDVFRWQLQDAPTDVKLPPMLVDSSMRQAVAQLPEPPNTQHKASSSPLVVSIVVASSVCCAFVVIGVCMATDLRHSCWPSQGPCCKDNSDASRKVIKSRDSRAMSMSGAWESDEDLPGTCGYWTNRTDQYSSGSDAELESVLSVGSRDIVRE